MSKVYTVASVGFISAALSILINHGVAAAPAIFTDRTAWETAAGGSPQIFEDFDSFADGDTEALAGLDLGPFTMSSNEPESGIEVGPPFDGLGRSFSEVTVVNGTNFLWLQLDTTIPGEQVTFSFDTPILSFGADINSADDGEAVDFVTDTGEIGSWAMPATDVTEFRGLIAMGAFSAITFSTTERITEVGLDNVSAHSESPVSDIPEPTTLSVLAAGLFGVGFMVLRRRRPAHYQRRHRDPRMDGGIADVS